MKKPPTPTAPAAAMISGDQLAALANLTPRRINQLAADDKIPKAISGKFPMLETITALFAYYQRDGEEIQKERLKKLTAERHMTELKLKRQRAELVPMIDVAAALRRTLPEIPRILDQKLVQEAPTPEEKIRGRKAIDEANAAIRTLSAEFSAL